MSKNKGKNQRNALSSCLGRLIVSLKDTGTASKRAEEAVSIALMETSKTAREASVILKEKQERYKKEMKQYDEAIMEGRINE
jgi:phosphotransferase system IIB component